jgi:hypothetical protein
MVKDYQRGWAWTRALLGVPAEEVHVCGEVSCDVTRLYISSALLLVLFAQDITKLLFVGNAISKR